MSLPWYLFVPSYYFLCAIYLLFGVHNRRFVKCVLKCLPVAVLLFHILCILVEHVDHGSEVAQVSRIKPYLWGLAFSVIGDGCLVLRKSVFLVAGIVSFATSLCIYIYMLGFGASLLNLDLGGVVSGLGISVLSATIFLSILKYQLKDNMLKASPARSILTVVLSLYFLVLSILLWSGILLLLRQKDFVGICSATGATMFYISDILIAASAIWDLRLLQGRALVMTTYYSAQLLFAVSVALETYNVDE